MISKFAVCQCLTLEYCHYWRRFHHSDSCCFHHSGTAVSRAASWRRCSKCLLECFVDTSVILNFPYSVELEFDLMVSLWQCELFLRFVGEHLGRSWYYLYWLHFWNSWQSDWEEWFHWSFYHQTWYSNFITFQNFSLLNNYWYLWTNGLMAIFGYLMT